MKVVLYPNGEELEISDNITRLSIPRIPKFIPLNFYNQTNQPAIRKGCPVDLYQKTNIEDGHGKGRIVFTYIRSENI
jgi:hypothetical protein